jgi:tripartite-type tricarboxylate transporter receptor subunit TctC
LVERFSAMGFESQPGTPEALGQKIKLETVKWAKAIKEAGMEPE